VSSEGGSISVMTGGSPAYSVSKAALNALTRLLAAELARDGILVNAGLPRLARQREPPRRPLDHPGRGQRHLGDHHPQRRPDRHPHPGRPALPLVAEPQLGSGYGSGW